MRKGCRGKGGGGLQVRAVAGEGGGSRCGVSAERPTRALRGALTRSQPWLQPSSQLQLG